MAAIFAVTHLMGDAVFSGKKSIKRTIVPILISISFKPFLMDSQKFHSHPIRASSFIFSCRQRFFFYFSLNKTGKLVASNLRGEN